MSKKNILYELDALKSEINNPVQLRTLNRIGAEIKRLQKIIDARGRHQIVIETAHGKVSDR